MKFLITIFITPLLTCGTLTPESKILLIENSIKAVAAPLIQANLRANPDRSRTVWVGISAGLEDFVLPLLSQDSIQINKIKVWFESKEFARNLPINNSEVVIIQTILNTLLIFIPPIDWGHEESVEFLRIGFLAFKSVIDIALVEITSYPLGSTHFEYELTI